jgi:hypothetical protein
MKPEQAKALREPFPKSKIGRLPKGGVTLDFVGHAATTDRLLEVDPEWTWGPVALDARGLPCLDEFGGLWIRLTVCGVSRLGYGDAGGKKGPNAVKEAIGDALRNAAMRFGVALDLWSKEDLTAQEEPAPPPRIPTPLDKAKARLWALAQKLNWDQNDLTIHYAQDNHLAVLKDADADALNAYADVLEQDMKAAP